MSGAEERKMRQKELRDSLQTKHGSKFNAMQYTFWAEAILARTHESMDDPPNAPLFGAGKSRRSTCTSGTDSPSKSVSLRSKYMEQLRELHSLFDIGALTVAEYEEQRSVIVDLMRQLNRK